MILVSYRFYLLRFVGAHDEVTQQIGGAAVSDVIWADGSGMKIQ